MNDIHANRAKVFIFLLAVAALFAGINIALLLVNSNFNAGVTTGLHGLFNMNSEASIPTWYAQVLLLAAGILFLANAKADRKLNRYWYGLAGIFVFLSIDEGAAIHELLTVPVRESLNITSGFLYYSWFIVYGLLFIFLAALYLRFYLSLRPRIKLLMFVAAAFFLSGAIGFEAIGASIAAQSGEVSLGYSFVTVAEETCELIGTSVLIYCLLASLRLAKSSVRLQF